MWPMKDGFLGGRVLEGRMPAAPLLLAVALLLGGCSHVLVYDERRDKQGQDAKKAVAEARISDTVGALEKSLAEVTDLEEARARDRATYLFDSELQVVVSASSLSSRSDSKMKSQDGLQTVVNDRLEKIAGKSFTSDVFKKRKAEAAAINGKRAALSGELLVFQGVVGIRFSDCQAVYAASADPTSDDLAKRGVLAPVFLERLDGPPSTRRAVAKNKFDDLVGRCASIDVAVKKQKEVGGGTVAQHLLDEIAVVQGALSKHDAEMDYAREELKVATDAMAKVAKETMPDASKLKELEGKATKVAETVSKLSQAVEDGTAHAIALAKLGHLEAVLGALAGARSDGKVELTADEKVSVAVIRDIAGWTDEANELLAAAKKPRLVPLVLAIDQQRLVIKGIEARQAGKKKRLDALQKQLAAVENEGMALAEIREALGKDPTWNAKSLKVLVAETKEKDKARLLRALSVYADDVKKFRAEADVWNRRALAAQYMEGLTRAKYAAAQWDGLSDSIATVLADYHTAGVKTSDIAEFFKALGLLSIGAGVAK